MNLERFLTRGQPDWTRLDELIEQARGRPERLGPGGVRELGRLYRVAAADLALARRRWAGDPIVARLDALVGVARPLVYDTESQSEGLVRFFTTTYWQRVRERPLLLASAAVLMFVPAALAVWWAYVDPAAALGLVPEEFRGATNPRGGDLGFSVPQQAEFASAVFTNNIRVTFLAFAGGIAVGLGTAFTLIYNGSFIGAVGGLAFASGHGSLFMELVTAHGVLELSCIVVAAAAGLRMGLAIVLPGPRTRGQALVDEARQAVAIVLGTAPWLVLAGLVEGFITPAGAGLEGVVGVGVTLGAIYWGLVIWRGRAIRDERGISP
ncbi:MAG: stage II sporulation protein M [Actinobacteria bacterium]|nr:stage II sporulation protein M [Actinomycetota bacterium]